MAVIINSFDHDGCIASSRGKKPTELIAENAALFIMLREQINYADEEGLYYTISKVMIGSNRQSWNKDSLNTVMNRNGAVVPLAHAISIHLEAEFDGLTLADIKAGVPAGYHTELFIQATQELQIELDTFMHFGELGPIHELTKREQDPYDFADFDFSDDKINIIYAQIHHQASLHPDEEITFNFFDDKDSILFELNRFFTTYPELLPENVQLNLHYYSKGELYLAHEPIYGNGDIDNDYYETVNIMGQIAKSHEGDDIEHGFHMARYMTPELIREARDANITLKEQANARKLIELAKSGNLPFFKPEAEIKERLAEVTLALRS